MQCTLMERSQVEYNQNNTEGSRFFSLSTSYDYCIQFDETRLGLTAGSRLHDCCDKHQSKTCQTRIPVPNPLHIYSLRATVFSQPFVA